MELGKWYKLSTPTDALIKGDISRFPIGLPMKLIEIQEDRYICEEPRGVRVEVPRRPVWRMGADIDIFHTDKAFDCDSLVETDQTLAEQQVEFHRNPDLGRWHYAKLNQKYAMCYSDWECNVPGEDEKKFIETVLAQSWFSFREHATQEFINAVCDTLVMMYFGEMPLEDYGEKGLQEVKETLPFVAEAITMVLEHHYIVATGWNWSAPKVH